MESGEKQLSRSRYDADVKKKKEGEIDVDIDPNQQEQMYQDVEMMEESTFVLRETEVHTAASYSASKANDDATRHFCLSHNVPATLVDSYDTRGVLSKIKHYRVTFKNLSKEPVMIIANSPRSQSLALGNIVKRKYLRDLNIQPSQSRSITIKYSYKEEDNPVQEYRADSSGNRVLFYDFLIFTAVHNNVSTMTGSMIDDMTDILGVSVQAVYVASQNPMKPGTRTPNELISLGRCGVYDNVNALDIKVLNAGGSDKFIYPKQDDKTLDEYTPKIKSVYVQTGTNAFKQVNCILLNDGKAGAENYITFDNQSVGDAFKGPTTYERYIYRLVPCGSGTSGAVANNYWILSNKNDPYLKTTSDYSTVVFDAGTKNQQVVYTTKLLPVYYWNAARVNIRSRDARFLLKAIRFIKGVIRVGKVIKQGIDEIKSTRPSKKKK